MKKILLGDGSLVSLALGGSRDRRRPGRSSLHQSARCTLARSITGPVSTSARGRLTPSEKHRRPSRGHCSGGVRRWQVGYDWQAGNCVFGLEADASLADVGSTPGHWGLVRATTNSRSWVRFTGRIGYASAMSCSTSRAATLGPTSLQRHRLGVRLSTATSIPAGLAGGGLEYLFTPNWSVKTEYLYLCFGKPELTSHGPVLAARRCRAERSSLNIVQAGVDCITSRICTSIASCLTLANAAVQWNGRPWCFAARHCPF